MPEAKFKPIPTDIPQSVIDRFWSKVEKIPNGCWIWTAGKYRGYGSFSVTRRNNFPAHRLAYFLVTGIDPQGIICHDCPGGDNPSCVNPDHVFVGNKKSNAQDASKKGMLAFGDRNSSRLRPERVRRGESHHWWGSGVRGVHHSQAKLTEDQVVRIRERVKAGERQKDLAAEFSVSRATICLIVSGKNWGHVKQEPTLVPDKTGPFPA